MKQTPDLNDNRFEWRIVWNRITEYSTPDGTPVPSDKTRTKVYQTEAGARRFHRWLTADCGLCHRCTPDLQPSYVGPSRICGRTLADVALQRRRVAPWETSEG